MEQLRFLFMADCQLGAYASFSGLDQDDVAAYAARGMHVRAAPKVDGFAWDAHRYRQAVAAANEAAPAFVVMGGDMLDDPADEDAHHELLRITDGLHVPMHWVPGNHDVAGDGDAPTRASLARYRDWFGPDHYELVHGTTTLLVVNSAVWVHAERLPDVHARQLAALEARLVRAAERDGPVLVCAHHPLFTEDPDEPDSYWNVPMARRAPLIALFAAHGVTTYLCGHWHRNGGGTVGDLEVVVTGPVGYPLGHDPSGFRIVEVDRAGVRHEYVALSGESMVPGDEDGQTRDHRRR